jgi:hypothetical protein
MEKIINQIKKGKTINLVDTEIKEIVLRLLDEGKIVGFNPYKYNQIKYRWIGD